MSTNKNQETEENRESVESDVSDADDREQDLDTQADPQKVIELQRELLERSASELEQARSMIEAMKTKNDQIVRAYQELTHESEMVLVRHKKALEDSKKYSCTDFAKLLLVAMDYLTDAMKLNTDKPSVYLGLKMGYDQLEQELKKHGILKMYCELGSMPNTNLHEVIGYDESSEYPVGTIVKVEKDGYVIHDRILRYASVKVAKGS